MSEHATAEVTGGGHGSSPFLAHHFADMEAQTDTSKLGMWLFLGSEVLFFSGLFTAYAVYRANHAALFDYAHHFLDWRMGALNTVVLLTSSLTAAWSVRCAQLGQKRGLRITLVLTLLLASCFLVVKYFEYSHKLHNGITWGAGIHPSPEILASLPAAVQALPVPKDLGTFFSIYYVMTGLHGIHVLIGMGLYLWLIRRATRGDFGSAYYVPVDSVALYWHIVDMIWIFLFPLFYVL